VTPTILRKLISPKVCLYYSCWIAVDDADVKHIEKSRGSTQQVRLGLRQKTTNGAMKSNELLFPKGGQESDVARLY